MKWLKKGLIFSVMVGAMLFCRTENASAKALTMDKTYQMDLDGDGVKERIKWKGEEVGDELETYRVKVYINGKQVLSRKSKNHSFWADVSVIDVVKNDGKKELYIHYTSESDSFAGAFAYHYEKGAMKSYFELNQAATTRLHIQEKQPGNGKVAYTCEFSDYYAYMGYVTQYYEIKDGKLKPVNKKTLNTTSEWRKKRYKTCIATKVYENVGDKTAAFTLPKGTEFKLQKIYVNKASNLGAVSYIYVKTTDGKKGWMKNPNKLFLLGYSDWDGTWSEYIYLWG